MPTMTDVVRMFRDQRVLVLGDVMLDSYYEGTAERLCTEGPVPIVRHRSRVQSPGGAGNVAANLRALGAEVTLLGVVGADADATALRAALRDHDIDDRWLVADDAARTIHKLRILADGQYVVRFDEGDTDCCSAETHRQLAQHFATTVGSCDAILVSDYNYGAISQEMIDSLRQLQLEQPRVLVIDSKNLSRFARVPSTVVTPNQMEARLLASGGASPDGLSLEGVEQLGRDVLSRIAADYAAITLAHDGVMLTGQNGTSQHFPAYPVHQAYDVGAGDTFAAALTLSLAVDPNLSTAVEIGIDAADVAISRAHTSIVQHQELLQRVSLRDYAAQTPAYLAPSPRLMERLERDRAAGRSIVFTNGVFDILHAGHVEFLRQAKSLGDTLVVAVNSDQSARRLKGKNRPINSEQHRLALIDALDAVDFALLFDAETPTDLVYKIRPDLHVKGGDYLGVELPEADAVREVGGEVVVLPLVGNLSTTTVIDRILALSTDDGQVGVADA